MSGEPRKFELSVPQIAGGALAAVTAAVAASYLGVAGTVIGAAVASVASTVGNAIYTHYLKRTGEQLKQHAVIAWRDRADPPVKVEGEGELATAARATVREESADEASDTLVMAPIEPSRRLPWGKVGLATALVFAISMGGILAYEALAGRTVAQTWHPETRQVEPRKHEPAQKDEKPRDETPVAPTTDAPVTPPPTTPTPTPTPTTSREPEPTPTPTPEETTSVDPSTEPSTPPTEEHGVDPEVADEAQPDTPTGAAPTE
ncbi:hypothetical protein [Nonomuraea sp. NPDC046570]|uniref:hypothetical protein n=1 Tax=Nonomuraea sp. NPDC046570 TaxID=3155255 RepID=UPI003407D7D2